MAKFGIQGTKGDTSDIFEIGMEISILWTKKTLVECLLHSQPPIVE